jgi:hypothetical protein
LAAQEGHVEVVEALLKAEADVNKAKTNDGATPLLVAAKEGHVNVVEMLLKAEKDIHAATTDYRAIAMRFAVDDNHKDVALLLAEFGASPHDDLLNKPQQNKLLNWMVEELKEQKKRIVEKEDSIERLVKGIPEWCAQQASAYVIDVQARHGGDGVSEPLSTAEGGRKRKTPELAAHGEGRGASM